MPVTVVLNSYHFLDDIVPAILSEEAEQTSQTSGVTQYPLFEAIENGRHTIITTAKIRELEYFKEAEDRNLSAFLPQIYDQLEVKNILKN